MKYKRGAGSGGELTLDDGHDSALLDGGRAFETVGIDAAQQLSLEGHGIERVGRLIVVGLDLACSALVKRAQSHGAVTLALGHILKTFVSHDCGGTQKGLQAWHCSRASRSGVGGRVSSRNRWEWGSGGGKSRHRTLCSRIKGCLGREFRSGLGCGVEWWEYEGEKVGACPMLYG